MTSTAPSTPPLSRRRTGRFVAGVASGVADHLGVPVLWVRAAFVALTLLDGAGVLAYGLLWVFVKQERGDVPRAVGRSERQQAFGLAALGLAVGDTLLSSQKTPAHHRLLRGSFRGSSDPTVRPPEPTGSGGPGGPVGWPC